MDRKWFIYKNNDMKIIEFNATTGVTIEREMTSEEISQMEAMQNIPMSTTTILTKYQFISRLTVQERIAIFELENTNAMVKMWLEMFKICDEIDLSNEETIQGINMLSQLGILANERIAELLKPL